MIFNKSIFSIEWLSGVAVFLSERVHREIEGFRIYLAADELERKINRNLELLGEAMLKQNEDQIQFRHALIHKIREDKNVMLSINNKNNSYLLDKYIYIYKLFVNAI